MPERDPVRGGTNIERKKIMKQLVPMDEYGVFADSNEVARVDSLSIAGFFEKRHDHVLRDIVKITGPKSGLSEDFIKTNFAESFYRDTTGRKLLCYQMTRDGFTVLVMGYTCLLYTSPSPRD